MTKEFSNEGLVSPEVLEATTLSRSVFGILPEESYFPAGHIVDPKNIDDPILREDVDDPIRYEVEKVIDGLPSEEKIFVIQRLGLAHAIHNTPSLIEHGLDVYLAQIPPIGGGASGDGGGYNFIRNAEMWIWNRDRVIEAKQKLLAKGKDELRGIALSIDTHAGDEDREGLFDRFFPTSEMLKDLGIKRVVFCEEVEPKKTPDIQNIIDSPITGFNSGLNTHQQLRRYKQDGFEVNAFGVDTRKRDDWE